MFTALKRYFVREETVRGASIILIVTLALSNILGVFRDHFLAQKIPTERLDIYFAAFRLPDLIFNVLILGSVAAAFVPVYSNYLKDKGQKEANHLAQATITIGVLAVGACLVVLFFLMPYLMQLLVPSFNVFKREETVYTARWLLLSPLFFTISYFLGGILNSHKRFLVYSIAPLIYNLSIIIAVLIFGDRLGVQGVVIGVIFGAFLHMLIQLPTAIQAGFRPAFVYDPKNPGVRRIFRLMIPRSIGLGANQILLLAFTMFASAFPGGIAIYNFADNIQTVPSVIFGTSFATAVFPTLAGLSLKIQEESERFHNLFLKTSRAVLFLMIPSSVVLFLLRAQIVRLILGYGFFGWSDTKTASATLGFFALSVIAQGLVPLLARSFYAMHNTKTPMITSIISIVVSIVLGFVLTRTNAFSNFLDVVLTTITGKVYLGSAEGVAGLALAFTIGSWLNLIMLSILIKEKILIGLRELSTFLLKIGLLTIIMVVVMQYAKIIVASYFDIDRVRFLLLQTIVALVVAALTYLGGAWVLKIREIRS